MRRAIELTRTYLVVTVVFVLGRFALELAGAPDGWTDEISVTRLLFVIPVFLGLRFASEGLSGFGELALANLTIVGWAIGWIMIVTAVDIIWGLHTHFGHGRLGPHLLGHAAQIAVMFPIATLIAWISYRINAD